MFIFVITGTVVAKGGLPLYGFSGEVSHENYIEIAKLLEDKPTYISMRDALFLSVCGNTHRDCGGVSVDSTISVYEGECRVVSFFPPVLEKILVEETYRTSLGKNWEVRKISSKKLTGDNLTFFSEQGAVGFVIAIFPFLAFFLFLRGTLKFSRLPYKKFNPVTLLTWVAVISLVGAGNLYYTFGLVFFSTGPFVFFSCLLILTWYFFARRLNTT